MKSHRGEVRELRRLNGKFYLLRLAIVEKFEYQAGQWVSLIIGEGKVRSYSVASAPDQNNQIELLVDVSPMGEGTRYVMSLTTGDRVDLIGPFGEFGLKETDLKRLLVATGSGLAPMRAMLQQMVKENDERETVLLWGLRYERDVVLEADLRQFQRSLNGFVYSISLSRASEKWQGDRGRVTQSVQQMDNLGDWSVYICGNRGMVAAVERLVLAKGVKQARIHYEKFY